MSSRTRTVNEPRTNTPSPLAAADPEKARECLVCGRTLLKQTVWNRLTADQRRAYLDAGTTVHAGKNLCPACRNRGGKPRRTFSSDLLMDEYRMFYRPDLSQAENCRRLARDLGMTYAAVERAVLRSKRKA